MSVPISQFLNILAALSSSTGINKSTAVLDESLSDRFFKSENYKQLDMFSIDAEKEYSLFYSDREYFIQNVKTEEVIEEGLELPYVIENEPALYVYNETGVETKYISISEDHYWYGKNKTEFFSTKAETSQGLSNFYSIQEPIYKFDFSNDKSIHKINNYEYFLKLGGRHGYNDDNSCTLVAIEVLLGYYDSFLDDDIVKEEWDHVSYFDERETFTGDWRCWLQSPGTGLKDDKDYFGYRKDTRMKDYLADECKKHVNAFITYIY